MGIVYIDAENACNNINIHSPSIGSPLTRKLPPSGVDTVLWWRPGRVGVAECRRDRHQSIN
jgi:hypothetical protein